MEDYPLSAVRDRLFDTFSTTIHICWPFFQPQPEDVPCRAVPCRAELTRTHLSRSVLDMARFSPFKSSPPLTCDDAWQRGLPPLCHRLTHVITGRHPHTATKAKLTEWLTMNRGSDRLFPTRCRSRMSPMRASYSAGPGLLIFASNCMSPSVPIWAPSIVNSS